MWKVIQQFGVKDITVMKLDSPLPVKPYNQYLIDGKPYEIVSIYDFPNCIAIRGTGDYLGKAVEFNYSSPLEKS